MQKKCFLESKVYYEHYPFGGNIDDSILEVHYSSYLYEGEYFTAFTMLGIGMIPGGKLGMKVVGSGFKVTRQGGLNLFKWKDQYGKQKRV